MNGRFELVRIHSEFEGDVGNVGTIADGRQLSVHVHGQLSRRLSFHFIHLFTKILLFIINYLVKYVKDKQLFLFI